jgi:hypothetical protein
MNEALLADIRAAAVEKTAFHLWWPRSVRISDPVARGATC